MNHCWPLTSVHSARIWVQTTLTLNSDTQMPQVLKALLILQLLHSISALECDPNAGERKLNPDDVQSYLYCNLEGSFTKKSCPEGMKFNGTSLNCEAQSNSYSTDDPFLYPQFQAPDDLCGDGIPMTRLSAPVVCNPSISSCPDGYECTVYARTGTAYCCQNPSTSSSQSSEVLCSGNQVTYIEPSSGKPKGCVLSQSGSCPVGFGCSLVSGTVTRCCGKQFGCPFNSAGAVSPNTGSHVECSLSNPRSCQSGFACVRSSMFNSAICCSETMEQKEQACPGGKTPLVSPTSCNSARPCPVGYFCSNGRCCPSTAICPAGSPLSGDSMSCSEAKPCPKGYNCITSGNAQYCCLSPGKICALPRDGGVHCLSNQPAVKRFYFDVSSGTCRSFQFTQCGGNGNNFDTLEQCQGFCVKQQCASGVPYQADGVNALCTPTAANTCPDQYSCQKPLFGSSFICCPTPESACSEMVTAGTACFGQWITSTRFYFNSATRKCQSFEYFGCSGNSNNFITKRQCEQHCLLQSSNVCNGVAALTDPNNHLQKCSNNVPCPTGYICNKEQFCCPIPPFACSSPMSTGNVCSDSPQRTAWYYDPDLRTCAQFTYFGCGGTPNRFLDRKSCASMCVGSENFGSCPKGMSPYISAGDLLPKTCTLNVAGTCPPPSSCTRSTMNTAICCQSAAQCPDNRIPYIIPGSDSVISCQIDDDNCPAGNECIESSVAGFFMCCSAESAEIDNSVSSIRSSPSSSKYLGCPNNVKSNGQRCTVNAVGECPDGYTCISRNSDVSGLCCPLVPKCVRGKTHFIELGQPQVCGPELASCPRGLVCAVSSVPTVNLCCRMPSSAAPKVHSITGPSSAYPVCTNGKTPYYEPGSPFPKQCITSLRNQCPKKFACKAAKYGGLFYCCPVSPTECFNGQRAYIPRGSVLPQGCSIEANNCPRGYGCHPSADGSNFLCCLDRTSTARCPLGSSEYLYGHRPLACPPGSSKCPNGYVCTQSDLEGVHLCCSGSVPQKPMCREGFAYMNPMTNTPQECSAPANYCPQGYYCQQSTVMGKNLCCTSGQLSSKFAGYCPIGQIPYVSKTSGEPRTCHMVLYPCPTTAQYTCIYSSEKQDSFCCAPIDTALSRLPDIPTRGSSPGCPPGSHAYMGEGGLPLQCNPGICPPSYSCNPTSQFGAWQCCSEETVYRKSPKIADSSECEAGSVPINGRCMRLLYIGQKGCQVAEQCSLKLPEARCDRNYCTCPRHKLIHGSKCVTHCPDGFINIAARCHDLTTVVFMDSVDERKNGTIGGFCKATVVEEEQCDVANAFCNERSITCQCKPGYELKMNFADDNDTGSCIPIKDSKFGKDKEVSKPVEDEAADEVLYFVEPHFTMSNETQSENGTLVDDGPSQDEPDTLNRYLFQTDENPNHQ